MKTTVDRATIQKVYVRVCQDSNYTMNSVDAARLAAQILKISPLEIWIAVGSIDMMDRVAAGSFKPKFGNNNDS